MSRPDLDVAARLEVHAILDRLVQEGETFSRDDALRLIGLIPVTPRRRFSFTGVFKSRGPGFRGQATGIGDVEVDGEGWEKQVSWNAPSVHRIGGYRVTHTPGQIAIELMWAETREEQSGQSCLLLYDPATGEPREMQIAVQRTLTLLFIRLAYVTYVPWKKPSTMRAGQD
jgi:hypothetical protein